MLASTDPIRTMNFAHFTKFRFFLGTRTVVCSEVAAGVHWSGCEPLGLFTACTKIEYSTVKDD